MEMDLETAAPFILGVATGIAFSVAVMLAVIFAIPADKWDRMLAVMCDSRT